MSIKFNSILRKPALWFAVVFLLLPVLWHASDMAFGALNNQFYWNQLGATHKGAYGANYDLTSFTAATTGTALIVPSATTKRLVIEKIIVSTDADLDVELAYDTTSTQILPTLHLGERGGICYDPYVALPLGATFWATTTDTANWEIWLRYREIP